jgi:AraC-like DNA-binding protein
MTDSLVARTDVLSEVLRVVRLAGAVFFTAELSSPWYLQSPNPELLATFKLPQADPVSQFHVLIEGECVVECDEHPATTMQAGDVIVVPSGHPHTMRSADATPADRPTRLRWHRKEQMLPLVSCGGGGRAARFICGYFSCNQRFGHLFAALPTFLLTRTAPPSGRIEAIDRRGRHPAAVPRAPSKWLETTVRLTMSEVSVSRPGNAAILMRLTELMFVEIIREYMQHLPKRQSGWLAGLTDAQVGHALSLMHAAPAREWTVSHLAREVAMSRSGLAQRFSQLIGESPMRYLSTWRMQMAKQGLSDGHSIQTVATSVGYESEAAFNRAFKRTTGLPPAAWLKASSRTPPGPGARGESET